MTTYQDIVDYLNEHYLLDEEYTVIKHSDYYTITDGDVTNDIYNDCYKSPLYIDKGLSHLLADLLDTPVNQRDNPEIKHTIKPVTKSNLEKREIKCSDSADEIIARINSFILKDFNIDNSRSLLLLTAFKTTFNPSELLQVLSIFKDFDITIKDTKKFVYPKEYFYTLSIKAK